MQNNEHDYFHNPVRYRLLRKHDIVIIVCDHYKTD